MIGVGAYERLAIGYDPIKRQLIVLTTVTADAIDAPTYTIDKRHYMSARRFCAEYKYDVEDAPFTFAYDRAASVAGVYYFRLKGVKAARGLTSSSTEVVAHQSL
ncbi:hypothetical protein I2483_13705 [Sporosarcina sp. E16_3]|uniref:hypothetical protein n=1 Tax=Sporosarcina sp. E16_3 TaxID=2789293 RepID=UPI001A92E2C6|nr:hypothetical protein [Sporosarcina sp. E16_3]MBO0602718.1 hypothetical protein [Sporosarcina sp. E16_3]